LDGPQRPTGGGGSVWPAWWHHDRCGRSSPELRATWLWCSIFSVFSSYRTGGVPVGSSGVGHAAARFKPQPSVFIEIPAPLPSISRGFGLIISCACRVLSPGSQLRLGFNILYDFVQILAVGVSVLVMTRSGVGDDRCWASPGQCMSEVGAGTAVTPTFCK
jgi:hypothetical protein